MYEREKRKLELSDILRPFQEKAKEAKIDFTYKTNPEDQILTAYELLLNQVREVHIEGTKINIYKVASGLEMATVYKQPIICSNPKLATVLNAELAYEIAFTFVFSKKIATSDYLLTNLEKEILSEHHEMLVYNPSENLYDSIVLTNSLFWKSLYCSVFQRINL